MGRLWTSDNSLDLVCEWLRKDKVTHALQADQRLEALASFKSPNESLSSLTTSSFCLTLAHGDTAVRFTIHPQPNDLTKEQLRRTTPKDEIEGTYWLIEQGQFRERHYAWAWRANELSPAVEEFCTLHDAVLYLCEVYT